MFLLFKIVSTHILCHNYGFRDLKYNLGFTALNLKIELIRLKSNFKMSCDGNLHKRYK